MLPTLTLMKGFPDGGGQRIYCISNIPWGVIGGKSAVNNLESQINVGNLWYMYGKGGVKLFIMNYSASSNNNPAVEEEKQARSVSTDRLFCSNSIPFKWKKYKLPLRTEN